MNDFRHIEIFRDSPDGTKVPAGYSPDECERRHNRTIGASGKNRKTLQVSLCAEGGVNLKQLSPERDLYYET